MNIFIRKPDKTYINVFKMNLFKYIPLVICICLSANCLMGKPCIDDRVNTRQCMIR